MASFYGSLPFCRFGTICFIGIYCCLIRTDIFKPLTICNISWSYCYFVYQTTLHINTNMFLKAIPVLVLAFTANPGFFVVSHLWQDFIIKFFVFLLNSFIPFLP